MNIEPMVQALLKERARHTFIDTCNCKCGYAPIDKNDWNRHVAEDQARAILAAMGVTLCEFGHSFDVIVSTDGQPRRVTCARCGLTRGIEGASS